MKYAAGGPEDKIEHRYQTRKKTPILPIILIVLVMTLLLAPQFSQLPIDTYDLNSNFNQKTNTIDVTFSLKNNTIGLLFNVKYTITAYDKAENSLGKKTISYAKIMLPKQTENISDSLTLPDGSTPAQIEVNTQVTRFKH